MLVDGNWKITMKTPLGPQEGDLILKSEGGVLSGQMNQPGNESEIENGTVNDDGDLTWSITTKKPIKITANITAKYDGADKITGKAKMGFVGGATLEAVRV